MSQEKVYLELPPFTGRNVPIIEIAKAMHKDAQYVRVGLQQGIFRFGCSFWTSFAFIPSTMEMDV